MNIRYLDHSGFAVLLQNRLLIFDYVNDTPAGGSMDEGVLDPSQLTKFDAVYFFVSHAHGDHFSRKIYSLAAANPNTHYLIAADVTQDRAVPYTVFTKGRTWKDGFLSVRACGSTDAGVSFLVEAAGKKLFHAGDLNCWHWAGEWSLAEENEARAFYEEELNHMAPYAKDIDIAFLPADPRMKGGYDDGAVIFAERFRPRHIVPMHCWGNYSVTKDFQKKMAQHNIDVFTYDKRGASAEYHD